MYKSGLAYVLCFLLSLIVGHAIIIVLSAYAPPAYAFFVTVGEIIDNVFSINYSHREIAAFVVATIVSFPVGILFHLFLKVERW